MKKSFIAIGVASLLGLTSVAQAADFTLGGSIRAGYMSTGGTTTGRIIGADNGSRINIGVTTDLGNGQSAGAELSYNVGTALSARRQNVFLSGGWGKLVLGQHGGIYNDVANWNQASFLAAISRTNTTGGGGTGLIYESNLAGPFSFKIDCCCCE